MTDHFFYMFFAALREVGCDFIMTRNDEHHKRFAAVAEAMEKIHEDDGMPLFIPSPFTGRFIEFEVALLQRTTPYVGGCQNITHDRAVAILDEADQTERQLFLGLAKAYLEDV